MGQPPIIADPEMLRAVYADLKRIARGLLRKDRRRDLMQTTMLVNEAFLKMLGRRERDWSWETRAHFFEAAVRNMRWVLVDQARRLERRPTPAASDATADIAIVDLPGSDPEALLVLDDALERLGRSEPERVARVAGLRLILGLTMAEIAEVLDLSIATVERDWARARRWLAHRIGGDALNKS